MTTRVLSRSMRAAVVTVWGAIAIAIAACHNGQPTSDRDLPDDSQLAALLGSGDSGFPLVLEPREFSFPADYGPHPEYRNEWWYVTGNLETEDQRRFGYELTLFRFALTPESSTSSSGESGWRSNQVFVGHFAVSDVATETFYTAERNSRGALGLAGARATPFRVWLEDWSIAAEGSEAGLWRLRAAEADFSIDLMLQSQKSAVANGDRGLSRKSADRGNASYYYSLTRLESQGSIIAGGLRFDVTGSSWMDREWGSSALSAQQIGWDWFALQFNDGRELMYYQLRRVDGSIDPYSSGTLTDAAGQSRHLTRDAVQLQVLEEWRNPVGAMYPIRWQLTVPDADVDVLIVPVFAEQELQTVVRYWEGAVDIIDRSGQGASVGRGYVELTGYADSGNRAAAGRSGTARSAASEAAE